jgi:hypothetical protein
VWISLGSAFALSSATAIASLAAWRDPELETEARPPAPSAERGES